ncbi:MAG: ABC transporter permease [Candidatus Dormibacteraeota bacterium]|uniref:Transport permease protein n=1 Tax=Candidatus Amunia macphersoniae TaxID=3127014 RepID=A0A934KLJ6_9BACT|nr:ABC transporter permease [Candidatus Dormibacteraeota bacterium]
MAAMTPTAGRSATWAASTAAITRRGVLKWLRTPQLVLLGTVQGALFLLTYRFVFGGAIAIPGVAYVDFLVPGFLATMVLYFGMGAATGIADDMQQGFIDRLRSLPIPRSSMLVARVVSDTLQMVWGLLATVGVSLLIGFRFHGTGTAALAALALCIAFGFAFEWMFVALGAIAGSPQAAQGVAFLVFPLSFFSSTYVQVETMPGWLRAFAEYQPVTMMVDAVRALALGPKAEALLEHSAGWYVGVSMLWTTGIVAVFAPIAVAKFRRG